jgi:uncharacterized membrane protein
MASDRDIRRYRRWYGGLLRLYPRPYRERFAEPMQQTFSDLLREHANQDRAVVRRAAWAFADTFAGIIRENSTQMISHNFTSVRYLRWVVVTAAVLAVPALLMAFRIAVPDPGSGSTDGVSWGPMDFAIIGVLVLGAGLLYEYASTRAGTLAHRAAVGIAVLAGLGLVWVNLAVGMMKVEPANLMYVLVLFVALIGAAIARFEPRDASIAMFATAGAQAIVVAIGLIFGLGPELRADAFFIAAWVVSGLLFREASVRTSPA